jgi:rhodanese-related sulfurtransferase
MTLLTVTPREVRQDWIARREIALLDLREEDPFAKAHPLFASQLPLSRLELEILDRVPRKDAKIVLYDNGEGLVSPAGKRLAALGYTKSARWRGASKAGRTPATSCSRTSIPTARRSANWSRRGATRRPCPPRRSRPGSTPRPTR